MAEADKTNNEIWDSLSIKERYRVLMEAGYVEMYACYDKYLPASKISQQVLSLLGRKPDPDFILNYIKNVIKIKKKTTGEKVEMIRDMFRCYYE